MALKVKYSDGTFGMGTEWLHDFLFDRFRLLATNPLTTALFRSVSGAQRNGVVLTNADTNNKGDRVPTKQKWYLWALKIIYQSPVVLPDATAQLMYDFMRSTLVTFKIENLDTMFSAPLSYFPVMFQVMQAPAVTVNSHFAMQDNSGAKTRFEVPLVLEENAVWYIQIDQASASAGGLDNHFLLFAWDREMYRQGG
jgi:hypothetical protein